MEGLKTVWRCLLVFGRCLLVLDLMYNYIVLWKITCSVGFSFVIHSTCHTPKKNLLFFFHFGKTSYFALCILWVKYCTNGHCFPKGLLFLFKSWILFIFLPSPAPLPLHPLLPPHTYRHRTHQYQWREEMKIMQPIVNSL